VVRGVEDGGGMRREVVGVDWVFNAWGGQHSGLYADWENDDAVARRICALEGLPSVRAPLVMEGGSFHVDGEG
jgi:agmatine deiminase